MKLSFKFFCVAYIMVLLFSAFGGYLLVSKTTDNLWNERVNQCKNAASYAANSFYSLSEIGFDRLTQNNFSAMKYQIKSMMNSNITDLQISPVDSLTENSVASLEKNQCLMRYTNNDDLLMLEIVSMVAFDDNRYTVTCSSDFSQLNSYLSEIWQWYRVIVLLIAVFCGAILFALTKKITKPLNKLSKATEEIADGNYGLRIEVKGDDEVSKLAQNFNKMLAVVAESLDSLQQECNSRDTFVANFTHEIKTPITSIIGYSDMLTSYPLTDEEKKAAAASVYKEGKRLEKMSMQLLNLFVTKEDSPELTCVKLADIASQLNSVMSFEIQSYEVALNVKFPDISVFANEELILSLLYNLIDNAFKASERGSIVNVEAEAKGDSVYVSVTDNGHGISKEHITRLTEPFYREDKSRSRRNGGAGLGLALCSEICKIHGSELKFESEKGIGTTVSFTLKAVSISE